MPTWPVVRQVDVPHADLQIPFVPSVLNTYARKRSGLRVVGGGGLVREDIVAYATAVIGSITRPPLWQIERRHVFSLRGRATRALDTGTKWTSVCVGREHVSEPADEPAVHRETNP